VWNSVKGTLKSSLIPTHSQQPQVRVFGGAITAKKQS
jgi:hypothetical protein